MKTSKKTTKNPPRQPPAKIEESIFLDLSKMQSQGQRYIGQYYKNLMKKVLLRDDAGLWSPETLF